MLGQEELVKIFPDFKDLVQPLIWNWIKSINKHLVVL